MNNLIDNSCMYVCLTGPPSYFIPLCSHQITNFDNALVIFEFVT